MSPEAAEKREVAGAPGAPDPILISLHPQGAHTFGVHLAQLGPQAMVLLLELQ